MSETPLTANLWWVIPNRLGGMRKPTPAEVPNLKAARIDAIVSVMDDPSNLDLYEQADIPHLWLPTTGGKAPTLEQLDQFRQFVEHQQAQNHSVVVHCSSGRRRTGTFLAAYLITSGRSIEETLELIHQKNPQVELREAQVQFLNSLRHE
jgi:protein-tyrosine phosphatase